MSLDRRLPPCRSSGGVRGAICLMTFFRRYIPAGARKISTRAGFLGCRLIRVDRRVRGRARDVRIRAIWSVTRDRVHRVKRWGRRSTVSAGVTSRRRGAWTRITSADGAAERSAAICCRVWSTLARSRVMRDCVGSAWSGLTCGVIAARLRRRYGAARDWRRRLARTESSRGLVRSRARRRVVGNMTAEYIPARKGAIRWTRRFRTVRFLRTWLLAVLAGRRRWSRLTATNRERRARTQFPTASSPARRYFRADTPVQRHATPAHVRPASFAWN